MYNNKLEHYNEIASKRLERDLKSKNISNKGIIQYVNIFKKSNKIRFLNIKFLSLVINYYDSNQSKIKINLMTKMLLTNQDYINDKSDEEEKLKYLASFIRYLYYVDDIIKNKNNIEEDYVIDNDYYEEYYEE